MNSGYWNTPIWSQPTESRHYGDLVWRIKSGGPSSVFFLFHDGWTSGRNGEYIQYLRNSKSVSLLRISYPMLRYDRIYWPSSAYIKVDQDHSIFIQIECQFTQNHPPYFFYSRYKRLGKKILPYPTNFLTNAGFWKTSDLLFPHEF